MAQVGCFVPADEATLPVLDMVCASLARTTTESSGSELTSFARECNRLGGALAQATSRSLIVADEFGCGTNPGDGTALFTALLLFLSGLDAAHRPRAVLVTHFSSAIDRCADVLGKEGFIETVVPLQMQYIPRRNPLAIGVAPAAAHQNVVVFLFRVAPGISRDSLCFECARLAGIPMDVVRRAEDIYPRLKQGKQIKPLGARTDGGVDEDELEAIARAFLGINADNNAELDRFLAQLIAGIRFSHH